MSAGAARAGQYSRDVECAFPGGSVPPTHHDEARDYGFADLALALRERAGLTQADLAALLGVSKRAVQTWEAGDSYPGAERLRQLVSLYLARGTFAAGQEEGEAAALWEAARGNAARRLVPFDPRWFASLSRAGGVALPGVAAAPRPTLPPPADADAVLPPRRDHWGEAPDAGTCYGRAEEEATLAQWLLVDRCRLVGVLGMGGIGKTLLAARVARGGGTGVRGGVLAQPAQRAAGRGVAGRGHRRSLRRAGPRPRRLRGAAGAAAGAAADAARPAGAGQPGDRPGAGRTRGRRTGRGTRATARCCGSWARAATRAVCC